MKTIKDIENKIPVMAKFLNKMFEYSKTDIQDVDFDESDGFFKNTYTEKDDSDFREYLAKNMKEYQGLFERKLTNKRLQEKAIGELLLMGGLRIEDKN